MTSLWTSFPSYQSSDLTPCAPTHVRHSSHLSLQHSILTDYLRLRIGFSGNTTIYQEHISSRQPHINSISIMNSYVAFFPKGHRSRKSREINKSFQSWDPGPDICLDNLLRAAIALFIIIIPSLIVSSLLAARVRCQPRIPHLRERERDMQSLGDANNMQPCIASSQPLAYFMRASIPSSWSQPAQPAPGVWGLDFY